MALHKIFISFSLLLHLLSPASLLAQTEDTQTEDTQETSLEASTPDWQVCNETSFITNVAVASLVAGTMTPRGWISVNPGRCMGVKVTPNSPRYVYAQSHAMHLGGVREWKGEIPFCARDTEFVANATIDCALQDLGVKHFFQVDPKEKKTTLIETGNYGTKAHIAGMQRLLRDNGYTVSRIDGIMGRRTQRILNEFLKAEKKPSGIPSSEIIETLAVAAQKKSLEIGLTLCNTSEQIIWSAIAYKQDTGWESKGWWPIKTQSCERIYTDTLAGKDVHIYAQQEYIVPDTQKTAPDRPLKIGTAQSQSFCISDAQFHARGRDNCTDRGYSAVSFKALEGQMPGIRLELTQSDFETAQTPELRR